MNESQNLDVAAPWDVPGVLRAAADAASVGAMELESAWQDKEPAKAWDAVAAELNRAADRIEKKMRLLGLVAP